MLKTFEIFGSAFLSLSVVGLTDACPAQGGVTWTQLSPANSPPARYAHAMAYDAARQRVVLFGGYSGQVGGNALGDTWEWDGTDWTQRLPATSPPARSGHLMAYDAARQRVVLFGNVNWPNVFRDTWEWDGNNWSDVTPNPPASSPPAGSAMAYHGARQRIVLFGSGQTWEWDGTNWTRRSPATSPSHGGAMTYDAARQRVVLFGAASAGPAPGITFEWDGLDWTQMNPTTSPVGVGGHGMAYDASRQRVLLFGGVTARHAGCWGYSDAWEWDGSDWTLRNHAPYPLGRHDHAMAYDATRGHVVMFGGWDRCYVRADTWEYESLSPASFSSFGTGCPGSQGIPTLDATPYPLPWTGDTFAVNLGNLPAGTFPFMAIGYTQVSNPIPQLPGCTQLSSAEAAVSLTLNGTTATWSQRVRPNPSLVGFSLFLQGAALNAGGSNVFGAALSNGGQVTIGMR